MMIGQRICPLVYLGWVILWLIQLQIGKVDCFRDGIFDYVSFEDPREWKDAYKLTCEVLARDKFREPRLKDKYDFIQPPMESKTPVAFNSNDTIPAPSKVTLHIFNNPGIRGGYSVSYGFQRNKECLHGQDADCVVARSFGSVRALVINAERFKDNQDLNYIKDHFEIEEQERFVTILNAGSLFERKFYEAVFLGGYPPRVLQDRGRSSHRIDGTPYPMEIYMYFVDETVPSMSLATILVVLVEESDRENPYIKPIVKAVKDKLHIEERRFIANNNALFRKERLYHNQAESIKYDVFEKEKKHRDKVFMERSGYAQDVDGSTMSDYETYEKMQALESQLYFLDEDLKKVTKSIENVRKFYPAISERKDFSERLPLEYEAIHIPLVVAVRYGIHRKSSRVNAGNWKDCKGKYIDLISLYELDRSDNKFSGFTIPILHKAQPCLTLYGKNIPPPLNGTAYEIYLQCKKHDEDFGKLLEEVCTQAIKFIDWDTRNKDMTVMENFNIEKKYQFLKEFQDIDNQTEVLNQMFYRHLFNNDSLHWWFERNMRKGNVTVAPFVPVFNEEKEKHRIMDNILNIMNSLVKWEGYSKFAHETVNAIKKLVKEHNFPDEKTMREVIHFHKYGKKNLNYKNRRNFIHDAFFKKFLPYQQKRRGFVEYPNMEKKEKEMDDEIERSPLKVKVDQAFQISWLIPPNGGYYYYAGSSPVPPCFRAQNVIVFKKPISMTRSQIETLTKIPLSFEKDDEIPFTTPVLHDLSFKVKLGVKDKNQRYAEVTVPVYKQKRNHLFLGHDGVHKNSVEEYEKREAILDARKKNNSPGSTKKSQLQGMWMVALIWIFI